MAKQRKAPNSSSVQQVELPFTEVPKHSGPRVLEPEASAKRAIARRTKPASVPGYVKLTLALEVRRELAEKLSVQAIREQVNIEAIVIDALGLHEAVYQEAEAVAAMAVAFPGPGRLQSRR